MEDNIKEGRLFVLTLSAGFEAYHVSVDRRHVTLFPYRTVSAFVSPRGKKCWGKLVNCAALCIAVSSDI
jgi:hypothetical protein